MSSKDDLQFHDSGGQEDVMFDRSDGQLHTFTSFPHSAVDMDDEDEEGGDKSQLIKEGEKKSLSFWTFEYYQQFFDVETRGSVPSYSGINDANSKSELPPTENSAQSRSVWSILDLHTAGVHHSHSGNLANYLSAGGKDYQWKYDFHKVTFAASAIFTYWWIIPAIMYGLLWWRKSQAGFTFLEILCVYGYSLAIYIPISILWVINVAWFKWSLVVVGAVLSGGVLVITFWPALRDDTKKIALIIVSLIFVLHLALAAGFVLYFFHVPPPASTAVTNSTTMAVPPAPTGKPLAVDTPKVQKQEPNNPPKPLAANSPADKPLTKDKDAEQKGTVDKPEKKRDVEQKETDANNNAEDANEDFPK